jgi:EAL domain-containing protein (putative c-di-GMP-specific phosphodiesterase class I)
LQVVAEGVENEFQKAALVGMNCWALQGYHLAPPMDKEAFLNWLKPQYEGMPLPMVK